MILKHSDLLVSNEVKKEAKERRAGRLRRKLAKEAARDRETSNELLAYRTHRDTREEGTA